MAEEEVQASHLVRDRTQPAREGRPNHCSVPHPTRQAEVSSDSSHRLVPAQHQVRAFKRRTNKAPTLAPALSSELPNLPALPLARPPQLLPPPRLSQHGASTTLQQRLRVLLLSLQLSVPAQAGRATSSVGTRLGKTTPRRQLHSVLASQLKTLHLHLDHPRNLPLQISSAVKQTHRKTPQLHLICLARRPNQPISQPNHPALHLQLHPDRSQCSASHSLLGLGQILHQLQPLPRCSQRHPQNQQPVLPSLAQLRLLLRHPLLSRLPLRHYSLNHQRHLQQDRHRNQLSPSSPRPPRPSLRRQLPAQSRASLYSAVWEVPLHLLPLPRRFSVRRQHHPQPQHRQLHSQQPLPQPLRLLLAVSASVRALQIRVRHQQAQLDLLRRPQDLSHRRSQGSRIRLWTRFSHGGPPT